MSDTNPNGANQYTLDPRQNLCWKYYIDPRSDTYSNAKQSAIKAGYEEGTASQITTMDWFIAKLRRLNLLNKAEKVLEETIEIDHMRRKIGMFGPIKDPTTKEDIYEIDSSVLKIKQDSAKFVAERVGKNDGYSTRTEMTGADGEKLVPENNAKIEELTDKLNAIYKGGSSTSNGESPDSVDPEVPNQE